MSIPRIHAWALAGLVALTSSCSPRSTNEPAPNPPGPSAAPTASLDATLEQVSCERPYQESSIWNVPIDWESAQIHPMSKLMMAAFFEDHHWIGSDPAQYAPNIYLVSDAVPPVPVQLREYRFRDASNDLLIQYGEPGGIVWMPLPAHARPSPGSDGQLAVINLKTGEEWGLNEGMIDGQGNWSAGGVYRYHMRNSGIPPEGFGQRGAGIGQVAGIVRKCEIERGRIDHAVTLAYDYPCAPEACLANGWPEVIPPFKKTDGKGTSQYDIPEGARIAVRPEIVEKEIESACGGVKGCVLWVLNMQEYGGFIVDNSGHPKTYAEGEATADWDDSTWSADMLRDIPRDWYVVVDWDSPAGEAP